MAVIEISCAEIWREISNYLQGEISAELRDRMHAHFEVCKHCSAMPEGFSRRLYRKIRRR
jgi:hypothetical protein